MSTTLESAEWSDTRLVRGNLAEGFGKLTEQAGGTIAIYANPKLVHSFIDLSLIDESRIVVHPVVIGGGAPLFPAGAELELVPEEMTKAGVLLHTADLRLPAGGAVLRLSSGEVTVLDGPFTESKEMVDRRGRRSPRGGARRGRTRVTG